jgi:hypothetical protein
LACRVVEFGPQPGLLAAQLAAPGEQLGQHGRGNALAQVGRGRANLIHIEFSDFVRVSVDDPCALSHDKVPIDSQDHQVTGRCQIRCQSISPHGLIEHVGRHLIEKPLVAGRSLHKRIGISALLTTCSLGT